ncbi:unnamed protein product [marine sediment metagenome]|uniref:Uncharacterized protein n=1 Tax=marine sediment metagenome TaxID=412755 RepID=X1QHT9_9ZZZZ
MRCGDYRGYRSLVEILGGELWIGLGGISGYCSFLVLDKNVALILALIYSSLYHFL